MSTITTQKETKSFRASNPGKKAGGYWPWKSCALLRPSRILGLHTLLIRNSSNSHLWLITEDRTHDRHKVRWLLNAVSPHNETRYSVNIHVIGFNSYFMPEVNLPTRPIITNDQWKTQRHVQCPSLLNRQGHVCWGYKGSTAFLFICVTHCLVKLIMSRVICIRGGGVRRGGGMIKED